MAKVVLRVVMLDTLGTLAAMTYENQLKPYGRRLVSIELTDEQAALLVARNLGSWNGETIHEEVGDVWIEKHEDGE